ncbi:MAG: hypothetical protein KKH94_05010 [Candidatus Omnitrophica bacterium]|nr:hypothetical protein [Candidatus Omnitrophota bacterium]
MNKSTKKNVSLMFSGGVDSTRCAVELAKEFDNVHLLTYETGYGHFNFKKSENRFRELQKIVGDKFHFARIKVKKEWKEFVIDNLITDYTKYKSGFIVCLGCKVLMHACTIKYAREHGIMYSADGASGASGEMVEQMELSVSLFKYLYEDYGIEYRVPVYDLEREDSIRTLHEMGFFMGKRILDRHMGIQPRCVRGELYYLPYLLFNKPPKHDEQMIARFMHEKIEIAKRYFLEG